MNLNKLRKQLSDLEADDLLNVVGLETRRGASDWVVPTLSAFGVGVLVGVGVGLLFAQKPGTELRSDLRTRIGSGETNKGATTGVQGSSSPRAI